MVRETWNTEEQRILDRLAELEDGSDEPILVVSSFALADQLGIERHRVTRALDSLHDANYLRGEIGHALNNEIVFAGTLSERGRRQVGQWPVDSYEEFLAALQQLADAEPDPEKKSRLRALADAVVGAGRDVVVAVLTEIAKKQAGV